MNKSVYINSGLYTQEEGGGTYVPPPPPPEPGFFELEQSSGLFALENGLGNFQLEGNVLAKKVRIKLKVK